MRFKIALLLILLATTLIESKRSRGRSRGSSSGGTGFWTRKKSNEGKAKTPGSQPEIKKETSQVQQSAPTGNSGRPIGWNVDNNSPVKKQNVNPAHTASAPYPQQNSGVGQPAPGGYNYGQSPAGGYNGQHAPGGYNPGYQAGGYNYGQQTPGGYHAPGGYNYGQQTPGGYNPGYQASGGYHAPGGYNYGQQTPGGYNPGYQAPGGYHAPGGYNYGQQGYNPGYHSSMGGYGGYSGGMFGNKYGGYGGYGGYGMKKSGGFFGKHAFRNVLGGLFVWYLVSGLVSKPYKVYNYYNQPKDVVQQEITLPANVLTLCNENATNICVPGTVAICTNDNRILCVTSMTSASPCQDNNGALCVNSTIPCIDTNDPLCQNKTSGGNTTTVNLPCFTNMTLDSLQSSNITLPQSDGNKFCVTTMAVPDPSMPPMNVTEETTNSTLVNGTQNPPMLYPPPPIPGNGTQYPSMWYPPPPPIPGNGTQYPPPPYWGYAPGFYPPPPYWGPPPMNVTPPENSTEVATTEVTTVAS